jgi:hypothetical protein
MMGTVSTSETSVYFNETTRRYIPEVALGVLVVSVLATGPKFECSNQADDNGLLSATELPSMTFLTGEVKPSAP